jgi:hypothetical protein
MFEVAEPPCLAEEDANLFAVLDRLAIGMDERVAAWSAALAAKGRAGAGPRPVSTFASSSE